MQTGGLQRKQTGKPPIHSFEMTKPLCATPMGSGNPSHSLTNTEADWLSASPDANRLLGPLWTASGLTLQAPCRLYAGESWRSGLIVATGSTSAMIRTAGGLERCTDRRNLQTMEEAEAFKRETAAFRRLLKKRQGGRTNG